MLEIVDYLEKATGHKYTLESHRLMGADMYFCLIDLEAMVK